MPDEPSHREPPLCKRCQRAMAYATAIPKRFDAPGYEIFRCLKCGEIAWVEMPAK